MGGGKNIELVQKEVDFYLKNNARQKSLWSLRLKLWINRLVDKNGKIKLDTLKNFRKYSTFLAETPNSKKNFIYNSIYQFVRRKGHSFSANESLKNFENSCDYSLMNKIKLSNIGNPGYFLTDEGIMFNERYLRHLRNIENINSHIFKKNKNVVKRVIDIGGGYSQFSEMLKRKFENLVIANVDFYEQLILAYYYLLENFPEKKICPISKIINCEEIDEKFINSYDFLLIPVECFNKLKPNLFDLITNFSSFGEMPRKIFFEYINNPIIKSIKYFYTVNRLDSFPTYENNISIIDYLMNDFKMIHLGVSPIWSNYYISKLPFFKPKRKSYSSRNFELIYSNENR